MTGSRIVNRMKYLLSLVNCSNVHKSCGSKRVLERKSILGLVSSDFTANDCLISGVWWVVNTPTRVLCHTQGEGRKEERILLPHNTETLRISEPCTDLYIKLVMKRSVILLAINKNLDKQQELWARVAEESTSASGYGPQITGDNYSLSHRNNKKRLGKVEVNVFGF